MLSSLRRTVSVTLLSLALFTPTSLAGDEVKADKARELMELMGSADLGQQMMGQMLAQFQSMGLDEAFVTEFKKRAEPDKLVEMIVPIYVDTLDIKTMDAAIRFYRSTEGRKLIGAMPEITQRSMVAGQKWGEQIGLEVEQALKQ